MCNEKSGCGCGGQGCDKPEKPEACASACSGDCGCEPEVLSYDPSDELISIEDFMKVKLRTAEIISAEPHPNADKLMFLKLKVGERQKQICAGIRSMYSAEELVGKTIIIVDNLKPAKLRGVESQGMLLAAGGDEGPVLLTTDKGGLPGGLDVR